MAERVPKKIKVEIPFLLREAVKNGRAVLFLGAGASKECRDRSGDTPPDADELRDIISQKYFGKLMPRRTVMAVAEMAIENGAGSNLVFQTVNDAFEGFEVSEAHKLVSDFNWRTIATTNYDTFLEAAYSDSKRRRTNPCSLHQGRRACRREDARGAEPGSISEATWLPQSSL